MGAWLVRKCMTQRMPPAPVRTRLRLRPPAPALIAANRKLSYPCVPVLDACASSLSWCTCLCPPSESGRGQQSSKLFAFTDTWSSGFCWAHSAVILSASSTTAAKQMWMRAMCARRVLRAALGLPACLAPAWLNLHPPPAPPAACLFDYLEREPGNVTDKWAVMVTSTNEETVGDARCAYRVVEGGMRSCRQHQAPPPPAAGAHTGGGPTRGAGQGPGATH